MDLLDQVVSDMDFHFFGAGEHGMSVEDLRKALGNSHYLFLDVRTKREAEYAAFPFAVHIPLEELPERLSELPRDKMIVTFCASVFRGAIAYTYLLAKGFEDVKGMTATGEEMITALKPGPLATM
jgi:rhodanese-related sulfurtransferase